MNMNNVNNQNFWSPNPTVNGAAAFDTVTGLQADLTGATAATINQLREAFQIQRLYERDARGGTRYTEILRSHFGVVSPDARLQRPNILVAVRPPLMLILLLRLLLLRRDRRRVILRPWAL